MGEKQSYYLDGWRMLLYTPGHMFFYNPFVRVCQCLLFMAAACLQIDTSTNFFITQSIWSIAKVTQRKEEEKNNTVPLLKIVFRDKRQQRTLFKMISLSVSDLQVLQPHPPKKKKHSPVTQLSNASTLNPWATALESSLWGWQRLSVR